MTDAVVVASANLGAEFEIGTRISNKITINPRQVTLHAPVLGANTVEDALDAIVSNIPGATTPYSLPIATGATLGGVKIGAGITEGSDGTISVPSATIQVVTSAVVPTVLPGACVIWRLYGNSQVLASGAGTFHAYPGDYVFWDGNTWYPLIQSSTSAFGLGTCLGIKSVSTTFTANAYSALNGVFTAVGQSVASGITTVTFQDTTHGLLAATTLLDPVVPDLTNTTWRTIGVSWTQTGVTGPGSTAVGYTLYTIQRLT